MSLHKILFNNCIIICVYRYVIVENLRYMLTSYNPTDPIFLGCRFKPYVKQGYMSGGAGNQQNTKLYLYFIFYINIQVQSY